MYTKDPMVKKQFYHHVLKYTAIKSSNEFKPSLPSIASLDFPRRTDATFHNTFDDQIHKPK